MNCTNARLLHALNGRVGELAPEDAADLAAHRAACPECARLLNVQDAWDTALARAMIDVPMPTELRPRIARRLDQERGAFYRHRIWQGVGIAVALLIGTLAIVETGRTPRPQLDLVAVAADPQTVPVERWLADQGIAYRPPVPFDTTLVAYRGHRMIQGQAVPVMLLVNREKNAEAEVLIFKANSFDFRNLTEGASSAVGGRRVEVLRDSAHADGDVYVVLHNGADLKPFLKQLVTA